MTKIVLTSDIHYGNLAASDGTGPFDVAEHREFAAQMHAEQPDVLIVAGDCAETALGASLLPEFFTVYKNPHGASLCVPGNHDLWLEKDSAMTWRDKYEWFFAEASRAGWTGLRRYPWSMDSKKESGLFVVGNMGWYDFSSADPELGKTAEDYERDRNWSDYIWMGLKNSESPTPMLDINRMVMEEMDQALSRVPDGCKELIVVTHFVGFSRLMRDLQTPDSGRAYFGNWGIGERAVREEADLYFCGHSHSFKEFEIGKTVCVNNGSSYGKGSKRYDVFNVV